MATRAAVGMSTERNSRAAARQAAQRALEAIGGAQADLGLVFATAAHAHQELVAELTGSLGERCVLIGCTGEGVIAEGESRETDHAVGVMAVKLDPRLRAEAHLVEGYGDDPAGAAGTLADRLGKTDDVVGVIVFLDGLTGDCTRFLAVLQARLPGVTVVGGAAGDAMMFERTWQYCGSSVATGGVAALVLRGKGELRVSVSHGCTPVGPHQVITKVEGGWVHELDGRPAWDVFKSYLDGDPTDLSAEGIVHLCIGTSLDPDAKTVSDPMVIRTPLQLDKRTGALFFPGGGLRAGQRVRMTRRDAERIRHTAVRCASEATAGRSARPAFVLQLDCAGRGKVMFGNCAADEIVKPLRAVVGDQVPWAGFHTYGEIAATDGALAYHNYTVVLCAFYDE